MDNSINIPKKQFDLTQSQNLLWAGQQISPFSPLYNMAFTYQFSVKIDAAKFQQAFQILINQSDAMRSRLVVEAGEPQLQIRKELDYEIAVLDFSNQENPKEKFENWQAQQVKNVFNIQAELFQSSLIKLGKESYIWYLNQHHLITDGWSITIQYQRMISNYQSLLNQESAVENSLPQFADYIDYESKKRTTPSISVQDFWKEKINQLPEIPSFFSKENPLANTLIHRKVTRLNLEKTIQLRELIKTDGLKTWSEDLSLFTFFLTTLYLAMLKVSGRSDLTIGTPVHNRNQPKFKNTIGVFIELFPIHIKLESGDTFLSLFEKVRDEYYQFMRYAQAGNSSAALSRKFNVVLNYINASFPKNDNLPMQSHWLNSGHADPGHHLKLQVVDFDNSGEIDLMFDGNTAIFTPEQLNELATEFSEMIDQVLADYSTPIKELATATSSQIQHFNDTEAHYPKEQTIVSLFEKMVLQNPDATAIVFENEKMSYRQLDEKSNQLASYLLSLNVQQEDLIAICLDRSLEMVIGLLGILKSGAAYVPIDPDYPTARIENTIKNTQTKIVISQKKYLPFFENQDLQLVVLDKNWESIAQQSKTSPGVEITPQNLMYVIYTSGSTGQPKGVMNQYDGLVNRLLWAQKYFEVKGEKDVVLQKTTFCFDVSVWEFFLPLISGSALILARPDGHKDSNYLRSIIEQQEVTMLHFVPPMLEVFLLEIKKGNCPKLEKVVCSGEELKPHQIEIFQNKLPHVELYNLYGPTEAAIDVTAFQIPKPFDVSQIVPIGKPVANTQIHILNSLEMPCPIGVAGELYIGGIQVARGYYRQPELTAERFVEFDFLKNKKLYKTGDAAMWLPDGNVHFLGRLDTQVKIRGFRVETAEIEFVLNKIEAVNQSIVLAKTDHFGNKYLVAYFVSEKEKSATAILENLKMKLPTYMVPAHLIQLEKLPLTINGKIDRKALPMPKSTSNGSTEYVAPSNEFEEIIQSVWEEVLQIEKISVKDVFFEIGGESLTGIRVVGRLSAAFEIELPVPIIFQKPTIEQLAIHIEEIITTLLQELEED